MLVDKKVGLVMFGREGAFIESVLNVVDSSTGQPAYGMWIIKEGCGPMGKRFDRILVMPIPGAMVFLERERILEWLRTIVQPAVKPEGELIFLDEDDDYRQSPKELIEALL